ncbi:ATPase, F1/V1/A1 complex, alpha/beta subunit [Tanacetum coccineum]
MENQCSLGDPSTDLYDDTVKATHAPASSSQSQKKIVKVSSLTIEEKVLGADVAIPIAAVDEICDQFANTLYGYFIGSWLAFPIVENYVRNAWAKYGFERVIVRNGFYLFKFTSQEGMVRVLNGGPWFIRSMHIMLNTWSANTKMKREDCTKIPVWVKIHKSLFDKGSGHYLETLDVEYEWRPYHCSKCNLFDHDDEFCPARIKKASSGNGGVSNIGSEGSMPSKRVFGGKLPVVDKPCGSHEASMDASPCVKGKSTYIQDDIDLRQLKEHMDRLMEENKILEFNTDVGTASKNSVHNTNKVSTSSTSAPVEVKGNVKGSLLEQFRQSKTSSTSDSDESEVEEVCMPAGGGLLDDLEDELDCFDGYEAQIYDLTEQEQAICDRFDIRLHSRHRK